MPLFDGRTDTSLAGWTAPSVTQSGCDLVTSPGTGKSWDSAVQFDNDYTLRVDWLATTASAQSAVDVGGTGADGSGSLAVVVGPSGTTGALRGVQGQTAAAPVNLAGQWNSLEISVQGNRVIASVNGKQVNDYSAPGGFWQRTFVAVEGDGTADPVHFRDIRVRDDRRTGSGAVTGVNGPVPGAAW